MVLKPRQKGEAPPEYGKSLQDSILGLITTGYSVVCVLVVPIGLFLRSFGRLGFLSYCRRHLLVDLVLKLFC